MTTPLVPDVLLIDINGLIYASMYTPLGKLEFEGKPTGAIHGALNSLFARMADNPNAVPFVLWDSKAQWRYDLWEYYKGSRKGDEGSDRERIRLQCKEQTPCIQLLLSIMGIPQVSCHGAEADDLAGILCRHMHPSWNIELTTRDTDWWQALDPRSSWYSPVHKKGLTLAGLFDPNNGMKDGHFLSTDEYLQAKALAGDDSDEIPGIEGVGLATAVKIIRKHGSRIEDFWSKVDAGVVAPKGVIETRVAEAASRQMFERNTKLMDWRLAPGIDISHLALTAGGCDFKSLEIEAKAFGLKKLLSTAEQALSAWSDGWGPAIGAVDSALHHDLCIPMPNPRRVGGQFSMFGDQDD